MLSLASAAFKPALSRSVFQSVVRSRIQPFSSTRYGALRNVVQKRPAIDILSSLAPRGFSRTLVTDAQAVTPASSQEAWKKFAITAVRGILPTFVCWFKCVGCRGRHRCRCRRFLEQRHPRLIDRRRAVLSTR